MHRKVVSSTSPLVSHGVPPVKKTVDPSLKPGEKVVDDPGVPAMSTSVTRDVYAPDGKLLYHDTWYSSYRAEPKLVRLGPRQGEAEEAAGYDDDDDDRRRRRRPANAPQPPQ